MQTLKQYINESKHIHPELRKYGIDQDAIKKFLYMNKTELDGSGLETRGEKMKNSRAKNNFFNHLYKIHRGDDKKVAIAYSKLSNMYDQGGEKSLYEKL